VNINFTDHLLKTTGATSAEETDVIQSLWSGYGKISRYELLGAAIKTVVVKHISLNSKGSHPRGWDSSNSHNRKVKSYQVETHWYEQWNKRCNVNCRTPQFLGSYSDKKDRWIILEDLDAEYPVRKDQLTFSQVKTCLSWLAHFHATFLNQKPSGLWQIGTYWHLETRPDELKKIEYRALKSAAIRIDQELNSCKFRTIVHGDAKLANFCFSQDGRKVAALDFQYVGGGCGMKDVAYFLGSCLSGSECDLYEEELLNFYFKRLQEAIKIENKEVQFSELRSEWEEMYPLACADFMRFMLGWMPSHQKVNDYNRNKIDEVLEKFKSAQ